MFTPSEREELRRALIAEAQNDERITGIAITGSAAADRLDEWSDIDLAFGIRDGVALQDVLDDFTERMRRDHGAVDTVDVTAGAWIYRVFLLANTLQVDLAFAPRSEFGARAATFRLVHGEAAQLPLPAAPKTRTLIGFAWLYALHARSSIARGRLWQAEYMLSHVREQIVALACLRHGLPHAEGRGVDRLPDALKRDLEATLVARLGPDELRRAFGASVALLLREIENTDAALAHHLRRVITELVA
ncbi:MAG TPA: nucleotidyltransferase domain-containing protein [Candidatus Limnocylindria bacterium]